MEKRQRPPPKLTDFKGQPLRVTPTKVPKDEGDRAATKILMDLYSDKDGFHCPRCGVTITDGDKAVAHLSEEINKALAHLSK